MAKIPDIFPSMQKSTSEEVSEPQQATFTFWQNSWMFNMIYPLSKHQILHLAARRSGKNRFLKSHINNKNSNNWVTKHHSCTCNRAIKGLESFRAQISLTIKNNREVIWWRYKMGRISISAESAHRGRSLVASIENLKETVLAHGVILELEFLEFKVNDVTRWDGDVPHAVNVSKIISRKWWRKEIPWHVE